MPFLVFDSLIIILRWQCYSWCLFHFICWRSNKCYGCKFRACLDWLIF